MKRHGGFFGVKKQNPRGIETQRGSTMPQLLLQGFPGGASRISDVVSVQEGGLN